MSIDWDASTVAFLAISSFALGCVFGSWAERQLRWFIYRAMAASAKRGYTNLRTAVLLHQKQVQDIEMPGSIATMKVNNANRVVVENNRDDRNRGTTRPRG